MARVHYFTMNSCVSKQITVCSFLHYMTPFCGPNLATMLRNCDALWKKGANSTARSKSSTTSQVNLTFRHRLFNGRVQVCFYVVIVCQIYECVQEFGGQERWKESRLRFYVIANFIWILLSNLRGNTEGCTLLYQFDNYIFPATN